jgi:hypothetical protein
MSLAKKTARLRERKRSGVSARAFQTNTGGARTGYAEGIRSDRNRQTGGPASDGR